MLFVLRDCSDPVDDTACFFHWNTADDPDGYYAEIEDIDKDDTTTEMLTAINSALTAAGRTPEPL